MHPVITKQVISGFHTSYSLPRKWLTVAGVLITGSPAATCTEQHKLVS